MDNLERTSIVMELINALRENLSWCGETHLQKTTFFLESLARVPTNFGFILYKHGPYSFELHDEITSLRANNFIELEYSPPYGPRLKVTEFGTNFLQIFGECNKSWKSKIDVVAEKLGNKNVVQLEKLGTALLVTLEGLDEVEERAKRINELKPHVSYEEAIQAVRELEEIAPEIKSVQ